MHILFFLVSFWAIFVSSLKIKKNLLNLIIAFLPAYIMIATREKWLTDDVNYYEHWNAFHGMKFSDYLFFMWSGGKIEPGFWLIEQISSFNATTFFISTIYIVTLIFIIYTFVPKKYYPFVVAFVFFNPQFATSISARRTTVAMCLFMIAVVLKCKEKRLFSIILAVSSVLFHNTAVFMLPFILMPIKYVENKFKIVVLGVLLVFILNITFPDFFNELFIDSTEDTLLEHYGRYAETGGVLSFVGFLYRFFIAIILFFVVLSYTKSPKGRIYSFFFLMTLVYLLLSMLNMGQARIKVYSSLFASMFVILSYHHRHKKETQVLLILFIAFITICYILWYQKLGNYGEYFSQYSSFLFN